MTLTIMDMWCMIELSAMNSSSEGIGSKGGVVGWQCTLGSVCIE